MNKIELRQRTRGRALDDTYPSIIEDFLAAKSDDPWEIDPEAFGKKPLTMRQGLNQTLKRMELSDKVLVSMLSVDKDGKKLPEGKEMIALSQRDKK
jgi:hypothetical protein